MEIIDYLKSKTKLTKVDEGLVLQRISKSVYHKGEVLSKPNIVSDRVIFVEKGFARIYYAKNNKDITFFFLTDNGFFLPTDSVYFNKPTMYGLQAEEELHVASMSHSDLQALFTSIPQLEKMYQMEMARFINNVCAKYYLLESQTAQERYRSMMENYPDILLHVSLGHIASYLGISQETLSRIRHK